MEAVAKWGFIGSSERHSSFLSSSDDLFFDLASLTKVILTSTLLVERCEKSHMGWDDFFETPVSEWVTELNSTILERITIRQFFEHRSGLLPHINIPELLSGEDLSKKRQLDFSQLNRTQKWSKVLEQILKHTLNLGDAAYSDLGFLLIGLGLERFYDQSLDELWDQWKKDHSLKANDLVFSHQIKDKNLVVPTESRHPICEVNDDNAAFLDGVAPHAGLFGTADGVCDWLETINEWVSQTESIKKWLHQEQESADRFYFGWDKPQDPAESHAGEGYPSDTMGHLGYTGTALWWSWSQKCYGVLLSNRVCPAASEENAKNIKFMRREFFSGLWQGKLNNKWQISKLKSGSI